MIRDNYFIKTLKNLHPFSSTFALQNNILCFISSKGEKEAEILVKDNVFPSTFLALIWFLLVEMNVESGDVSPK